LPTKTSPFSIVDPDSVLCAVWSEPHHAFLVQHPDDPAQCAHVTIPAFNCEEAERALRDVLQSSVEHAPESVRRILPELHRIYRSEQRAAARRDSAIRQIGEHLRDTKRSTLHN